MTPRLMSGSTTAEPVAGGFNPRTSFLPGHGYRATSNPAAFSTSAAALSMSAAGSVGGLTPRRVIETSLRFGTAGTPESYYMGNDLMPDWRRDDWEVLIIREDDSHLRVIDTSLGLEEPYPEFQFVFSTERYRMAMNGAAFHLPRELHREIANVEFQLVLSGQRRLERVMNLDAENVKAELLAPDKFDPANVFDLAGSEVDAVGGDGLAAIEAAEQAIIALNPTKREKEDMLITMSPNAWRAFRADKAFFTSGAGITHGVPSFAQYAEYLGYRPDQIQIKDAISIDNGVKISLWDSTGGGIVYVRLRDDVANTETSDVTMGGEVFALNHVTDTEVPAPWFDPPSRTDHWPAKRNSFPVAHTLSRGAVIFNVKAP